jgi:ubiquinone/menaquinone biosynthesis C-methylase UbiE
MVLGYARARPPVHQHILNRVRPHLREDLGVALDLGCGAGLSTRALQSYATTAIGLEPLEAMLRLAPAVAPGSRWIAGSAEALPIRDGSIDLVAAAGSLNYVDLERFFPEAARVLKSNGVLLVYDFSAGRRFVNHAGLEQWFREFQLRYPPASHEARLLSPRILSDVQSFFQIEQQESFEAAIPLTVDAYINYMLTETNVASAMRNGASMAEIRSWCDASLRPLWQQHEEQITFESYYALLIRNPQAPAPSKDAGTS